MMILSSNPLVSVVVVSYNAADTVIETLDSVLKQTYNNIELIISDDCSEDNTEAIVSEWLEQHKDTFKGGACLLTAGHNQGVCANFNKAINFSKGEWIKIIAADDILMSNCCEDYVKYTLDHPEAQFMTSYVDYYHDTFDRNNCVRRKVAVSNMSIFEQKAEVQLREMAYKIFVMAPTMFFSRYVFNKVGGFDERYIYEDHPFYMNLLENGYKIYFVEATTVGYRIHDSTVNSNSKLFNYRFAQNSRRFRKERCLKYYSWSQRLATKMYYSVLNIYEKLGWNRKNKCSCAIFNGLIGAVWKFGEISK